MDLHHSYDWSESGHSKPIVAGPTRNILISVLYLISLIFWVQLIQITYDFVGVWYLVPFIIGLMFPLLSVNLNFLQLAEEKGLRYTVKNINRVFNLSILQIKRIFSDDDDVSLAQKKQDEEDKKFLLGEDE